MIERTELRNDVASLLRKLAIKVKSSTNMEPRDMRIIRELDEYLKLLDGGQV